MILLFLKKTFWVIKENLITPMKPLELEADESETCKAF